MSRKGNNINKVITEKDVDEYLKNNKDFTEKWFKNNINSSGKVQVELEETVTQEDELAALNYTNTPSR